MKKFNARAQPAMATQVSALVDSTRILRYGDALLYS